MNSGKNHPPALTKREQIPRASDIGPFYRFVRMNRGGKGDIPFYYITIAKMAMMTAKNATPSTNAAAMIIEERRSPIFSG